MTTAQDITNDTRTVYAHLSSNRGPNGPAVNALHRLEAAANESDELWNKLVQAEADSKRDDRDITTLRAKVILAERDKVAVTEESVFWFHRAERLDEQISRLQRDISDRVAVDRERDAEARCRVTKPREG